MTAQRRGIIAAGTLTVDRLKVVDSWPQEEHLAVIISTEQNGGGSAHNVGVDICQLDSDMPVEIIGLVGSEVPPLPTLSLTLAAAGELSFFIVVHVIYSHLITLLLISVMDACYILACSVFTRSLITAVGIKVASIRTGG